MPGNNLDMADGGMASRKFWLSVGTSAAIFAAGILAGKWEAIAGVYPAMIGGLLGVLTAYAGANLGAKFVLAKSATMIGTGSSADEAVKAPNPQQ